MNNFTKFGSCLAFLTLGGNLLATNYYVSNSGNDKRGNGSITNPWKTIAQVNRGTYRPGDGIYFQGGQSFSGGLSFTSASAGTAANPIVISSYGTGTATILPGRGTGLYAYNTAGFSISNLHFVGSGGNSNGISFYTDLAGGVRLDTVIINQVEVNNFGKDGIAVGSWNGSSGYSNVRITYASSHDNGDGGITMYGASPVTGVFPHQNVYIGHSQAYNNLGIPTMTAHSTGNGIWLGQVQNATIERCVAYNNGTNNTASAGPVGIWAYESDSVTIQYNESHHNHNNSFTDGDGFDLDGGVTNSVMQYNYSHDNDGAGYLICGYSGVQSNGNNTVRYNISQNDARKQAYGAIFFYTFAANQVQNIQVYNNTVYLTPNASGNAAGVISQTPVSNVALRNNIFIATGGAPLLQVGGGQSTLAFQGNDYWTNGGPFTISWAGSAYSSLAAWRSTGQETLGGGPAGTDGNPMLSAPGTGGTINNADLLNTLSGYRLMAGSPMIDAGLNLLTLFGINPGATDFFGDPVPQSLGYDVGAAEY